MKEREMEQANVTQAHILVVENDPGIAEPLVHVLEKAGFIVTLASDGEEALELLKTTKFDLVLLDIVLPTLDGTFVVRRMHENGDQTPVILMSGYYTRDTDEVAGLELGADDYIRKPFTGEVLIARIRNVLRRRRPGKRPLATYPRWRSGPLCLDRKAKRAYLQDRDLNLKRKEIELLECLMFHSCEVLSRERLLDCLPGSWIQDPRIIDRYMAPLRKALKDDPKSPTFIETVHGVGYHFIGPVEGEE
jgi:DNA-binding response OmpR family regulator